MITLRRARPLLGTLAEIRVQGHDEMALRHALEDGFAAIERVQRFMSFHEAGSDVSRLNREANSHPVTVSPETYQVLTIAGRVSADCGMLSRFLPVSHRRVRHTQHLSH